MPSALGGGSRLTNKGMRWAGRAGWGHFLTSHTCGDRSILHGDQQGRPRLPRLPKKTCPIPRLLNQRTGDSHYHWTKKWGAGQCRTARNRPAARVGRLKLSRSARADA